MPQPVSQQFVTNTTDTNSVVEVKYVNGGWLTAANSASLAAIDITRGADGQIAYVQDEGLFYKVVKQDEGFDDDFNFLPEIFKWYELPFSGSFSGSFQGDGSNLTGLTAGFPFTGSAEITGSLSVFGPISGSSISISTGSIATGYKSGRFYWNSDEETMNLDLTGDVTLQLGQEQHYHVINQTGDTIDNGDVVYVSGVSSGTISVSKFTANDTVDPELALGIATEEIVDTETGFVTSFGRVRNVNTSGFAVGDVIWASTTTAGGYQNTRPNVPNHSVEVGFVTKVGSSDGIIHARITHKDDADEIQFNPSASTLLATTVQNALEELDANKASIDALSSNITLYPTTGSSPIPGYFRMVTDTEDADYNDTPVDISTSAISGSEQFIAALSSDEGVFIGNPGVINITTLGNIKRTNGNGTAKFFFKLYESGSSGEVLLSTSNKTAAVESDTYQQFNASALLDNGSWLATERIVIKYFAERVSGAGDPTYEFQFGGSSPVKTLLPVPVSVIPSDNASDIVVDTSNFDGILDANDNNIQDAFDTIDDHSHTLQNITDTGNTTTNRIIVDNITADTDTLYTSGSSVGIGTDTLTHTLTIVGDGHLTGDFTVTGRVTAEEFHTEFVSASILFKSGSTIAGNSLDDTHQFSGSLLVTGQDDHYLTGGNVGIGTSVPRVQLDVAGQAAIGLNTPTINNSYTAVFGERPAEDYYSTILMTTSGSLNRGYYFSTYVSASNRNFSITDVLAGNVRMKINQDGTFQLPDYGSGGYTGTTAYGLGVDSSGNIIEISGGGLKGTGTANRVAYWTAADTIAADNDFFFDGTNVGIGTTDPQAKLHIQHANEYDPIIHATRYNDSNDKPIFAVTEAGFGASSIGELWVGTHNRHMHLGPVFNATASNIASGSAHVTIQSGGNVGIGVTNPDGRLHVYNGSAGSVAANTNADDFIIENNSAAGMSILTPANQNGNIYFGTVSDNKSAEIVWVDSSDTLLLGSSTAAGNIKFRTGNQSDAVTIITNGNVGVGTTTPVAKLEVAYEEFETYSPTSLSSTQMAVANRNTTTSGSQVASIHMYTTGHKGSTTGVVALNAIQELGNSSTGTFTLQTRNAGSYAERMRVQYDGNVGIGTTTPIGNLDVADSSTSVLRLTNTDTAVSEGQITGQVEFYQQDSSGGGTGITGKIAMRSATRPDSDAYFGNVSDMAFFVSGTGTGQANDNATKEAMTIRAGRAYVGIGTTDPASKLEVYNDGIADIRISGNQETDTRIGGVSWYNITGSEVIAAINVDRDGANDAGAITFDTQPAGGGNTERMRIDSTGKIKFNAYGSGNNTGTAAYTLRVDTSGRVIEDPIGSGAVDGAAQANQVTFWKDTNTVSGSTAVTWDGSTFTIDGTLEATEKSFVINHPTKEDKKLVYGVLEGPEHAVYCRGKVTSNVIELPEVWTGLVDEDSITVQLTSIGKHQNLYVEDIRDNKIFIKNSNVLAKSIKAFYFVQGTRKDVKPLVTERDK